METIFVPKRFVPERTSVVVTLLTMNCEQKEIDEIKIWQRGSESTWQAKRYSEHQIASVVHMPSKSPKSGSKQFTPNCNWRFAPYRGVWIHLELVFLRIGAAKNGKPQTEYDGNSNHLNVRNGTSVMEEKEIL